MSVGRKMDLLEIFSMFQSSIEHLQFLEFCLKFENKICMITLWVVKL